MDTTTKKKLQVNPVDCKSYTYSLVITCDGLYIMSPSRDKISEVIVYGSDNNGWLMGTDDIDVFLDSILTIKELLSVGYNPLIFILPSIYMPA